MNPSKSQRRSLFKVSATQISLGLLKLPSDMNIAENERAKKAEQGFVGKNLELRPFSSKTPIDAISSFL
jgi:hypothetical protein